MARELKKQDIERMVDMNVIEISQTEWAFPIVFMPWKNGTLHFCLYCRKLKAVKIPDSYPIPHMDECIDLLADTTIFLMLEANRGYCQVEIADHDYDKSAFTPHHRILRLTQILSVLKSVPGTFQRATDVLMTTVKWQFALVY